MNAPLKKRERRSRLPLILSIVLILALIGWTIPLPQLKTETTYTYKSRPEPVSLAWPAYGEATVGAEGYGILDSHGPQTATPMASVTKAITAMAVLSKKPLNPGDQGPTIKITAEDVNIYNTYKAQAGSVVEVVEGEQISEYQALQAMMIPSANNMAYTLARWAFGSIDNYIAYTNAYIKKLGLQKTAVADASGFSPESVSTSQDLVILGQALIKNPVLSDIVSQKSAEIPVAGTVKNTNWLLGVDGVTGIKTGNTDEAGGCYLFAAKRDIQGQSVTVIGAVMGAPDLETALKDSRALLNSVDSGFTAVQAVKRNQVVGQYVAPWGKTVSILAKDDLSVTTWKTRQVSTTLNATSKAPLVNGQIVGNIKASVWDKSSSQDVYVNNSLSSPSWQWRLYKRYFGG